MTNRKAPWSRVQRLLRAAMVALVATCVSSIAFSAPQFTVFKTAEGAMIAWNESKAHFTVELPGKTFKHVPMEGVAFIVDGRFIQVLTVDPSAFSSPDKPAAVILQDHRAWETEHYEKQLGEPPSSRVKAQSDSTSANALLWEIEWPAEAAVRLKATTTRTLFATQVVGDRIVTITTRLTKADEPESAWLVLQRVRASLTPSIEPLDFKAIQEQVRNRGVAR